MRKTGLIVLALSVATIARADFGCDHTAARRVNASLAGVSRVLVIGRAGSLRVTGHAGGGEVVGSGTACSSDEGFLKDIQLRAERHGSELTVEAVIPERMGFFDWGSARLDFEVTLPETIALEVRDGSGEATIENVGDLRVHDGSGELTIRGVHGNADVTDGSGELIIADVSGDVRVRDGSGEMEIDRVGGNVVISDGSGGIAVRNVQRNVTIESDGSGSVDVRDVRGDFTVESKGSGEVTSDRIGGRVTIPRRR
jgi:hypothetical protein